MITRIKKRMLTSLGAVVIARKKAQKIMHHLVENGKISEEEGHQMVEEMIKKVEDQKMDFEEALKRILKNGIDQLDIRKCEDYNTLKVRVKNLGQKAKILEGTDQHQK